MTRLTWLRVCLLLLALPTHIFSQTSNATLGGTVADASGALIPGVEIAAKNNGTGIVSMTISNESGAYNFPNLQTGSYTVSAELTGFRTQTYNNVTLGVSQQVRLNFKMDVGGISQSVEVNIAADTLIATSSSSIGSVLPEYKIRDLPVRLGNVMDLVSTTPGSVKVGDQQGYFAGGRQSQANVTRDGINVNDGRYEFGATAAVFSSPDMVEEVRVIVGPADAETSRGSGQVQMATRSGTNAFRGSAFWTNQNSIFSANDWFSNSQKIDKNYYNRNEYGARLGGPIVKNKTFFFAFFEGQRVLIKEFVTGATLTEQARKGIFRYFPNVDNGNTLALNPTVDANGNPLLNGQPATPLSFNVFGRDPLRTGLDTSSFGQQQLARMPLPNDFSTCSQGSATSVVGTATGYICDGMNVAGIRFLRRVPGRDIGVGYGVETNRDQYNLRLDHNFNASNKLFVVATREKDWAFGQPPARSWPTGFDGTTVKRPDVYTINFVSTLSASLVNQLTLGRKRSMNWAYNAANRNDEVGQEAVKFIPTSNGIQFRPYPLLTAPFVLAGGFGQWREGLNPQKTVSDNLSWTRGKHAFKGGAEWRFTTSNGFNDPDTTPAARYGAGAFAVQGIDATAFPGLTANNQSMARNLLMDLAGSIGEIRQSFLVKNAQDLTFYGSPTIRNNRQILTQHEFSGFFKDDWKMRSNLTVNLGVHYEWYGAPFEKSGLAGAPVGGPQVLQCGYACGLVTAQFVGKNSTHPELDTYNGNNDRNNFAPNIGVSWNLPWWGQDKTVVRAGYGVSYTGALRNFIGVGGVLRVPGSFLGSQSTGLLYQPGAYTGLSSVSLPIPQPLTTALQPIPVTDRSTTLEFYNHVAPYIQNWNLEIQRTVAPNTTIEVRYVGTKGTKLWGVINLNTEDVFANQLLAAFNATRAGDDAPLFTQMLNGINIGGGASTVNGVTMTGSQALRLNSTTRAMLANGNVGSLANYLNTQKPTGGNAGDLIRLNRFPENLIVRNPQFAAVNEHGNPGNSTYHSLQLQFTKRLSQGFTNSTTYTWSRTLGEADGDGGVAYLDPRNRSLNKTLLTFHREHSLTSNGTWDLPFGPNRSLLSSGPNWLSKLVENWQFGGILGWTSGQPLTISTGLNTIYNSNTGSSPDIVGDFPKSTGEVSKQNTFVTYFPGLKQDTDPGIALVTSVGSVNTAYSNKAIKDEATGKYLLVNPVAGTIGAMGQNWVTGPGILTLDMNLIKRISIDDTRNVELRVVASNILNHAVFGNPQTNINNVNFGRITSTASGTAPRQFVTTLRLNF